MKKLITISSILLISTLSFCGFEEYDKPTVPETLTAPPVDEKYEALQGVLEVITQVLRANYTTEQSQAFGPDTFESGAISISDGAYSVATGVTRAFNEALDVYLKEFHGDITFTNYTLEDVVKSEKDWVPGDCVQDATINGTGTIDIKQESVDTSGGDQEFVDAWSAIDFANRGIYFGKYTITINGTDYEIDFGDSPGFFYSKQAIEFQYDGDNEPSLAFALSYTGVVSIDGQEYTYQDVYLEAFDQEKLNGGECNESTSVAGTCSLGSTYGTQSECETAGGTWN